MLSKVSDLPVDDTLKRHGSRLELDHNDPWSPVDGMLEVLDNPPRERKHLHIVVPPLSSGKLSVDIATLSPILIVV
jgi:hypothetical protein